jgi:serine/threonine protein kinase
MNKDLAPNTTISHYRIERQLGAGGMGEVYLAQDERLRRPVALKLLPAKYTADGDWLQRFEQEASTAISRRRTSCFGTTGVVKVAELRHCQAHEPGRPFDRLERTDGAYIKTGPGVDTASVTNCSD